MKYAIIPREVKIGLVKAVHDGDSIKVQFENETVWVRLYGCDAPEVISNYVSSHQPFGKESGQALRDLLKGKEVKVETLFRDQFSRMICKVYLSDVDVTEHVILNGLAWVLSEPSQSDEERLKLKSLHEHAKGEHKGLWGFEGRKLRPSTWRSRNRRFSLTKEFEDLW